MLKVLIKYCLHRLRDVGYPPPPFSLKHTLIHDLCVLQSRKIKSKQATRISTHFLMANCHCLNNEQISNSVLNWARLGHGQYKCEMSTKRNACPNHVSTSGTGSSKQGENHWMMIKWRHTDYCMQWQHHRSCQQHHLHRSPNNSWCCCWKVRGVTWNLPQNTP
jgi:hypothetical protein